MGLGCNIQNRRAQLQKRKTERLAGKRRSSPDDGRTTGTLNPAGSRPTVLWPHRRKRNSDERDRFPSSKLLHRRTNPPQVSQKASRSDTTHRRSRILQKQPDSLDGNPSPPIRIKPRSLSFNESIRFGGI